MAELCSAEQRDEAEVLGAVVRKYLRAQRLQCALQNPELAKLYQELAPEDMEFAEEGLAKYRQLLEEADAR